MATLVDNDALTVAENALAQGIPFGSYEHISKRLFDRYAQLLAAIADEVAGAQLLLDVVDTEDSELKRVILSDPLVRRTIEDGVCLHKLGIDAIGHQELDELLSITATCAADARTSVLGAKAECMRISCAPHHGYLWSDTAVESAPARRFKGQCLGRLPGFRIVRPREEELKNVVEGAHVVDRLLPRMGWSALSHTSMVVVMTTPGGFNSLTVPGLPGVVFLSPTVLATPVRAAEAILHESMHLKLMDIDYVEQLFPPGFRPQLSPKVTPPWRKSTQGEEWPLDRLLTAMHVYTTLVVFFERVEHAAAASDDMNRMVSSVDVAMQRKRAIERANYLIAAAKEHPDTFSESGRDFIKWIEQILRNFCGTT